MDNARIRGLWSQLYGEERSAVLLERLGKILSQYSPRISKSRATDLSERDAILIAYPDQV